MADSSDCRSHSGDVTSFRSTRSINAITLRKIGSMMAANCGRHDSTCGTANNANCRTARRSGRMTSRLRWPGKLLEVADQLGAEPQRERLGGQHVFPGVALAGDFVVDSNPDGPAAPRRRRQLDVRRRQGRRA